MEINWRLNTYVRNMCQVFVKDVLDEKSSPEHVGVRLLIALNTK